MANELFARIKAVLRRAVPKENVMEEDNIKIGELTVIFPNYEAFLSTTPVRMSQGKLQRGRSSSRDAYDSYLTDVQLIQQVSVCVGHCSGRSVSREWSTQIAKARDGNPTKVITLKLR